MVRSNSLQSSSSYLQEPVRTDNMLPFPFQWWLLHKFHRHLGNCSLTLDDWQHALEVCPASLMVSMEQTVHLQSMRYKRISAAKEKDVNVLECVYDQSGI